MRLNRSIVNVVVLYVVMCALGIGFYSNSDATKSDGPTKGATKQPILEPHVKGYKVIGFFGGREWRYKRMPHIIPGFLCFDEDGELTEWDLREVSRDAHSYGVKMVVSFDGEKWAENFLPMSDLDSDDENSILKSVYDTIAQVSPDSVRP